jgi:hypothetical protein
MVMPLVAKPVELIEGSNNAWPVPREPPPNVHDPEVASKVEDVWFEKVAS